MIYKILLFVGVGFNVVAQILLKQGMKGLDVMQSSGTILQKLKLTAFNPLVWGALFCYGAGFVIYSVVLSRVELSKAYPAASVAAILLIAVLSIVFMNESVSLAKIVGFSCCVIGILLIFR